MSEHHEEHDRPQLASGYVELNEGDDCPRCTAGLLFKIAHVGPNVTLRCFNCNTQGSYDTSVGHKVVTTSPHETPTGFTLSQAQLAARDATDTEAAAAAALRPEAESGVRPPPGGTASG